MRIFALIKGLFGKQAGEDADASAPPPPQPAHALSARKVAAMPPISTASPAPMRVPLHATRPAAPAVSASDPAPLSAVSTARAELELPLATLVGSLPVELQSSVVAGRIASSTVALPLSRVLPQLGRGAVRVTFGEIRASAPDAFNAGKDWDATEIALPLSELVSRIAPSLMRRRAQRRVEVPSDIQSPFGARGLGLSVSKPESATPVASPRVASPAAPVSPAAEGRVRGPVSAVSPPRPPGAPPHSAKGNGNTQETEALHRAAPVAPVPPARPAASPAPAAGGGGGTSASRARPDLLAPLARLSGKWPDAVRMEMAEWNLSGASVALPAAEVEAGLKRGKVAFTWRALRSLVKPSAPTGISAHDNLLLELPLAVLAPLFLSSQRPPSAAQQRVVVDEKIPNLFFGFSQPGAAPVPAPQAASAPAPSTLPPAAKHALPAVPPPAVPAAPSAADTNYFIWDDERDDKLAGGSENARGRSPDGSPGTNFLSRKATPNEVVTRAATLEGVYGAFVALGDGLLVAAKLDGSCNGETVAALIPQMYSKLSGSTKELRMGELNNLHFTVGRVPWKIFRVNGLFFAAYGRVGEPLPGVELAKLASDLDYRNTK